MRSSKNLSSAPCAAVASLAVWGLALAIRALSTTPMSDLHGTSLHPCSSNE